MKAVTLILLSLPVPAFAQQVQQQYDPQQQQMQTQGQYDPQQQQMQTQGQYDPQQQQMQTQGQYDPQQQQPAWSSARWDPSFTNPNLNYFDPVQNQQRMAQFNTPAPVPAKHGLAYKLLHPVGKYIRGTFGNGGCATGGVPLADTFPQSFYATPTLNGGFTYTSPTHGMLGYSIPNLSGGSTFFGSNGIQGFSTRTAGGGFMFTGTGTGF